MSASAVIGGAVLAALLGACGGSSPVPRAAGAPASRSALIVDATLAAAAEELAAREGNVQVHAAAAGVDADPVPSLDPAHMVDEARQRYVAIEFEEALATIREAVVLLESEARTREDFDLLADALLIRGMAELGLGRDDAARASLLAAARLRPERELDEGRYPPQVRERYEALRAELRAEPASSITITTRPAGAQLFLDGEPRGVAPETLYATSGRHQLRVTAPGHAERTLAVVLDLEGEQLEVELPRIDAAGAAVQIWESDAVVLEEETSREVFADAMEVGRVVVARGSGDGVTLMAIDLATGERTAAEGASLADAWDGLGGPDVSEDEGARRHDGFFARLSVGTALRGDEHVLPDDQKVGGGSVALDYELAAGGSLSPGVVLGGALLGMLGGPELSFDMVGNTRMPFVTALAAFFSWYPKVTSGWHIDALVGGAGGRRTEGGDIDASGLFGGVLGLGGGFEWWLASELSLGLSGRFLLYGLRATDDASWSILSLGLAGTLTYN